MLQRYRWQQFRILQQSKITLLGPGLPPVIIQLSSPKNCCSNSRLPKLASYNIRHIILRVLPSKYHKVHCHTSLRWKPTKLYFPHIPMTRDGLSFRSKPDGNIYPVIKGNAPARFLYLQYRSLSSAHLPVQENPLYEK